MLSLTHIHLRVQDPEDAAQWYLNNLEASIIERYQTSAGGPSVAIDIGGTHINIMGNPPGEELPPANPDPHMGLEQFLVLKPRSISVDSPRQLPEMMARSSSASDLVCISGAFMKAASNSCRRRAAR